MAEYHLKSTTIPYLEPQIIEQFAKVKLISLESNNFVWINPLCLAATSPSFADLEFEEEDLKIITEHSIRDLEQIVKFCYDGTFPTENLSFPTNVFQDFGIGNVKHSSSEISR